MQRKIYIDFRDLIGGLVTLLYNNGIKTKKISYTLIDKYANILLEKLTQDKYDVNFILTDHNIGVFFYANSEYFEEAKDDGCVNILTNLDDVLVDKYRPVLLQKMNNIFLDKEVVSKTLDAYKEELKEKSKVKFKNRGNYELYRNN